MHDFYKISQEERYSEQRRRREDERRMFEWMKEDERQRQMKYANRGKATPVVYPTLIDDYLKRKEDAQKEPKLINYGVNLRNGNIHF